MRREVEEVLEWASGARDVASDRIALAEYSSQYILEPDGSGRRPNRKQAT
jgi:hypothetical protein